MPRIYCFNYRGERVLAPPDFRNVVASVGESTVVWSVSGRKHKVRYGLQMRIFNDSLTACHEFGECVRHMAECEGKFRED